VLKERIVTGLHFTTGRNDMIDMPQDIGVRPKYAFSL